MYETICVVWYAIYHSDHLAKEAEKQSYENFSVFNVKLSWIFITAIVTHHSIEDADIKATFLEIFNPLLLHFVNNYQISSRYIEKWS